jgi:hypothetical protein
MKVSVLKDVTQIYKHIWSVPSQSFFFIALRATYLCSVPVVVRFPTEAKIIFLSKMFSSIQWRTFRNVTSMKSECLHDKASNLKYCRILC